MNQTIGRRVRELRQRAGLTATALAGEQLSVATVSRIEHGAIEPSLATLRYLATRLGCSPADLLRDDQRETELRWTLTRVEACLLLGRPLQAVSLATRALEHHPNLENDASAPDGIARLVARLRWSVPRAQAVLEPARAPEVVRDVLAEATAAGDDWSLVRLTIAWATPPTTEGVIPLLLAALARLTDAAADPPDELLMRAWLLQLLAQHQERAGSLETARGLYSQALECCERLFQPEPLAASLLASSAGTMEADHDVPAVLALAILSTARRLWTSATLALAHLDAGAHRLTEAARRLRLVQTGGNPDVPAPAALAAVLAAATADGPVSSGSLPETLDGAALPEDERQRAAADLAVAEGHLLAGRLEEAEQLAATVAVSLTAVAPEVARRIWLRLALAWSDAGHAPRAARAIRAALGMRDSPPPG